MKNIHLLPTNKQSKLYTVNSIGKLDWSKDYLHQVDGGRNQNIYITSDEEIKNGDWIYDILNNLVYKYLGGSNEVWNNAILTSSQKIVLTTDQDLIKDGVQAIDDEFLEWFVKNPSCERVEVELFQKHIFKLYTIIIPKEEPKIKCYCGHTNYCDCGPLEPKQETLEEAAEKAADNFEEPNFKAGVIYGVIEGAKWQAERMYSEEESIQKIIDYVDFQFNTKGAFNIEIKKWFEQFKKK